MTRRARGKRVSDFHIYTPFSAERFRSPLYLGLPFACGYEYQDKAYHSYSNIREGSPRVLFKYTLSGSGLLELDGDPVRRFPVQPGEAFLLYVPGQYIPGKYRYLTSPDSDHWEFLYFSFSHPKTVDLLNGLAARRGPVIRLDREGPAASTLWRLFDLLRQEGAACDYLTLAAHGYSFLNQLFGDLEPTKTPVRTSPSGPLAQRLTQFSFLHLNEPVRVREAAAFCDCSYGGFVKRFAAETGESPARFLRKPLLQCALRMLREDSQSVKQAALRCGFADPSYFARCCRREFGASPSKLAAEQGAFYTV